MLRHVLKLVFLFLTLLAFWLFWYGNSMALLIMSLSLSTSYLIVSKLHLFTSVLSPKGKAVVITGCDTGFGHLLALQLDSLGVTVFAGCLNANNDGAENLRKKCSSNLHVLQMDVTKGDQVKKCVEMVKSILTPLHIGLWGVVNNAGLNFIGDVELTAIEQYERVFQINVLGTVRVTKQFLPLIRKSKGRIVNVTSVKGRECLPVDCAYALTKHAGEAFSDILRMEMKRFGVTVVIIEPGHFGGATGCMDMKRIRGDYEAMWQEADDELRAAYGGRKYLEAELAATEAGIASSCFNLSLVTDAMTDALLATAPKRRYLIAGSSHWYDMHKVCAILYPILPAWFMDNFVMSRFPLVKIS